MSEEINNVDTIDNITNENDFLQQLNNATETLQFLFHKYKNNHYAINRMVNNIQNMDSNIIKTLKEIEEKTKRREKFNEDKDNFINNFLQTHQYSYCQNTELFFKYDGVHYSIYDEDNIHHEILKSITKGQTLMPVKHKIKSIIFKQIKDTLPMKYIPESTTIQYVMNHLYPIFNDKDSIKYFLTIIGDNILKKKENLIYIISPNFKNICNEILNESYNLLGINHIFNAIKYKYYDHNYSDCRLIMTHTSNSNNINTMYTYNVLDKLFYKNILDFICVACHYSNRYGNADEFLLKCNNDKLREHALFLKTNNIDAITDDFVNISLEKCNGTTIKWKNMLYLWKLYLDKKNIPNIVFNSKLKSILSLKIKFNEDNEEFLNVTSIQLPIVSSFLKFWDENIIREDDETDLEIGEICNLFKNWSNKNIYISEKNMIDLIQHFYNDIIIEDHKFVHQISCKLWNKKNDIISILNNYKISKKGILASDNLHNVYQYYCEHSKDKQYIISKQYFEKVVIELIGLEYIQFIDGNNLIDSTWWNQEL